MALTKTNTTTLFTSASVAAGTAKGATVGTTFDGRSAYAMLATIQITNGSSAPAGAPTLTIQISGDGSTAWSDYASVYGDTTASSVNTYAVPIDVGAMYVRATPWGNTTNAVTYAAQMEAVTAL